MMNSMRKATDRLSVKHQIFLKKAKDVKEVILLECFEDFFAPVHLESSALRKLQDEIIMAIQTCRYELCNANMPEERHFWEQSNTILFNMINMCMQYVKQDELLAQGREQLKQEEARLQPLKSLADLYEQLEQDKIQTAPQRAQLDYATYSRGIAERVDRRHDVARLQKEMRILEVSLKDLKKAKTSKLPTIISTQEIYDNLKHKLIDDRDKYSADYLILYKNYLQFKEDSKKTEIENLQRQTSN